MLRIDEKENLVAWQITWKIKETQAWIEKFMELEVVSKWNSLCYVMRDWIIEKVRHSQVFFQELGERRIGGFKAV